MRLLVNVSVFVLYWSRLMISSYIVACFCCFVRVRRACVCSFVFFGLCSCFHEGLLVAVCRDVFLCVLMHGCVCLCDSGNVYVCDSLTASLFVSV